MRKQWMGLGLLALACAGPQTQGAGAELKVTRAVLYQNGVGLMERRGKVDGGVLRFSVRSDQIGDVLKSLTVVDLGPGRPVSIGFPVEKSRARRLAELPPQVREGGGIVALAEALRGARATVETEGGKVTGRIIGLDRPADPKNAVRLSVLVDGGVVKQFAVERIESLRLLDQTLEIGLQKSLDVALNDAAWRPIPLEIRLDSEGKHDLVVSYVVEMPIWKPAYRLVFTGKNDVLLQGWAIVDNVSGEDWKKVALSLVAGTPLAFSYDLYTPRYRRRADLTPPEDQALDAPPEAEVGPSGAMAGDMPAPPPPPPPPASAPAKPSPQRYKEKAKRATKGGGSGSGYGYGAKKSADDADMRMAEEAAPAPVTGADLERNARTLVQGVQAGALFRYDIGAPVTVMDRESALVNIVNGKVKGEDALLFRVGVDAQTPYRVARFTNDTGLVLERGPIAIYRDGAFLGETVATRIDPAAVAYVPYALEPRVRLDLASHEADEAARLVRIVGGVIYVESKHVTRHVYDVANKSDDKLVLYVQRDKRTNWTIAGVDLERNKQKTAGRTFDEAGKYYVPVELQPKDQLKVTVREETPSRTSYTAIDWHVRRLFGVYLSRPDADPKLAPKLKECIALSESLDEVARRLDDYRTQKQTLAERQQQIRENIKALEKTKGNGDLKAKLGKNLSEVETRLSETMRKEILAQEEETKKREELIAMLRNITWAER